MLAGDLHDFGLPDVLRLLADGSKTGTLHVERAGDDARIDIDGGAVVALGVGTRLVSADDDAAVDLVSDLLGWQTGTFSFESTVPGSDTGTVGVAIAELLHRAATRTERLQALAEAQGPRGTLVAPVAGVAHDVSLSPSQWALVVSLGGGRTIEALIEHGEHTELATRELIDDLVRQGLLDLDAHQASVEPGRDDPGHEHEPEPEADDATRIDGAITRDVLERVVQGLEAH